MRAARVKPPKENPAAPPPALPDPARRTGATGALEGGVGVALKKRGRWRVLPALDLAGKLSSQQIQVLLTRGRRCVQLGYQLLKLSSHAWVEFAITDLGDEGILRVSGAGAASGEVILIGPLDRGPQDADDRDFATGGAGHLTAHGVDVVGQPFVKAACGRNVVVPAVHQDENVVGSVDDSSCRFELCGVMHRTV